MNFEIKMQNWFPLQAPNGNENFPSRSENKKTDTRYNIFQSIFEKSVGVNEHRESTRKQEKPRPENKMEE